MGEATLQPNFINFGISYVLDDTSCKIGTAISFVPTFTSTHVDFSSAMGQKW